MLRDALVDAADPVSKLIGTLVFRGPDVDQLRPTLEVHVAMPRDAVADALDSVTDDDRETVNARLRWAGSDGDGDGDDDAAAAAGADLDRLDSVRPARAD